MVIYIATLLQRVINQIWVVLRKVIFLGIKELRGFIILLAQNLKKGDNL